MVEDYKEDKISVKKEDIDIIALLKIFTSYYTNVKQSERNIVQVNGNNNEVQIPNEEGPGSTVQGEKNYITGVV